MQVHIAFTTPLSFVLSNGKMILRFLPRFLEASSEKDWASIHKLNSSGTARD
jgi:hypothetical protein